MCHATIFLYPFKKEGWGERWDAFKPLPIDMCSFEGEHSCNMFDMTSWWLPQPWGISVGMTPYPHCEFCFHKCKPPPHPLLRQRWIISKIRACLNAVKSSPGCPHCSRSGWVNTFVHHTLPWHINYAARPCIPQFTSAIKSTFLPVFPWCYIKPFR